MRGLRLLGAALFVLCGWCMGDAVRLGAERHLNDLSHTVHLLNRIRQEVGFCRTDLTTLYEKLKREGELSLYAGADSLCALPAPPSFSAREKALFQECFSGLGRAAADTECARLDAAIAQFEALFQQEQAVSQPQRMLARRLGLGAGLTAAILIL